jgi:hypothetical protein
MTNVLVLGLLLFGAGMLLHLRVEIQARQHATEHATR